MNARRESGAFGAALVLAAAVLWGTVGPAQVLAASALAPAAVGGWRLLVGGSALAFLAARRPALVRVLARRDVLRPALICAVATGVFQAAFLASVARTGAALATVVTLGFAPAATGLYARWATAERTGAAWWAGTGAAVAGCALLTAPGGRAVDPAGVVLAVLGGCCYGVYTVEAKRVSALTDAAAAPVTSAFTLLAGSVVLLPWVVSEAGQLPAPRTLALVGWLGLVTTGLAYWLFTVGVARVRATTVGALSLAEPLAAALLGVLVLHERLSPTQWAGCAVILAGMLAACLPTRGRYERPDAREKLKIIIPNVRG
jgi:DME family drug/metabolite transporter